MDVLFPPPAWGVLLGQPSRPVTHHTPCGVAIESPGWLLPQSPPPPHMSTVHGVMPEHPHVGHPRASPCRVRRVRDGGLPLGRVAVSSLAGAAGRSSSAFSRCMANLRSGAPATCRACPVGSERPSRVTTGPEVAAPGGAERQARPSQQPSCSRAQAQASPSARWDAGASPQGAETGPCPPQGNLCPSPRSPGGHG